MLKLLVAREAVSSGRVRSLKAVESQFAALVQEHGCELRGFFVVDRDLGGVLGHEQQVIVIFEAPSREHVEVVDIGGRHQEAILVQPPDVAAAKVLSALAHSPIVVPFDVMRLRKPDDHSWQAAEYQPR